MKSSWSTLNLRVLAARQRKHCRQQLESRSQYLCHCNSKRTVISKLNGKATQQYCPEKQKFLPIGPPMATRTSLLFFFFFFVSFFVIFTIFFFIVIFVRFQYRFEVTYAVTWNHEKASCSLSSFSFILTVSIGLARLSLVTYRERTEALRIPWHCPGKRTDSPAREKKPKKGLGVKQKYCTAQAQGCDKDNKKEQQILKSSTTTKMKLRLWDFCLAFTLTRPGRALR